MKKRQIRKHVRDLFKKIELLAADAARNFRQEKVHRFRVEIKKLRALLRLLNLELGKPNPLKIPKSIRKFYKNAGELRNIQNHLAWVDRFFSNKQAFSKYPMLLKSQMRIYQVKMGATLPSASRFDYEKSKLLARLPLILEQKSISSFLEEKRAAIKTIVGGEKSDTALHLLRKHLKDIQYNQQFIKGEPSAGKFPFTGDAKELIKLLGNHQDYFIHLSYLQSGNIEKLSEQEKQLVRELHDRALRAKADLRDRILKKLVVS